MQYDPLQVGYLADELNQRLRSRGTTAAPFFAPDLSVTLPLDRGEGLRVDVHPERGWFRLLPAPRGDHTELDAIVTRVSAPPDERTIRIDLRETGRFREQSRALILELHTNQWNAILLDEDERIVNLLRARRAGRRSLFPGEVYAAPAAPPRYGAPDVPRDEALDRWMRQLGGLPAAERRAAVLRHFAWTGTMNADWILGAEAIQDLEEGFERWWWLRGRPPARPRILLVDGGAQPYPVALSGIESRPANSLLDAMAEVSESVPSAGVDPLLARATNLARERLDASERKAERLRAELESAGEADVLRGIGDLLLAKLHQVPRGEPMVEMEDWEERPISIELDPQLNPAENAARYYDLAGRKKRAEEQLPKLLQEAERDEKHWREALESVSTRGEVPEWLTKEIDRRDARAASTRDQGAAAPYRSYRTSGGLEVRVGRNSRDNDRLTFHASSPNDVWLHARSVPGSHVILRWPDADASPPARDLGEAALIAAVFSRARTSGTVAVDWTRRKYVRKPRGAPPGAVIPQQVRTLFVEPDEHAVERMR
ncbi:MAG: NFACT RNA binding domain-containing protein, partial [Gemmatimonadota bacterium]